jgi:hypothetical protein
MRVAMGLKDGKLRRINVLFGGFSSQLLSIGICIQRLFILSI